MVRRCAMAILPALLAAGCLAGACAETARYRVVSFFFVGVPLPEALRPPEPIVPEPLPPVETPAPELKRQPDTRVVQAGPIREHPPYKEFRCGACHDMDRGLIRSTPQEGLCRACHGDVPGDMTYVHGPVAVSDCLVCHDPHGGTYPYLLVDEPTAVCFRCHDQDDVLEAEPHATVAGRACTDCHHGHGGEDRFFLKTSER